ncbi:MAG: hypothetical protein IIT88_04295 [Acetobacter sp.]|nr:hypothetical protein [Acetobacter sp.]
MTSNEHENEHNNHEEHHDSEHEAHQNDHHEGHHEHPETESHHEEGHHCCGGKGHKRKQFADYIRQDLEDLYNEHQEGNLLEKILAFVQSKPLEAVIIVFMVSVTLGYCLSGGRSKERKNCKKICKHSQK